MKRLNSLLLICLPIILNIISFVIFAPLFIGGKEVMAADFEQASILVGFVVLCIEIIAFLLILVALKKENNSIKQLINYDKLKVKSYVKYFLVALVPTLFAGLLYCRAQVGMGIETDISKYTSSELFIWLILTPMVGPFLEEFIWRGYCLPKFSKSIAGIVLTSISFAFFHGIFSPLILLATLFQGVIWGLLYLKTKSIIPGFLLHFISRYLLFIPGFVCLIK
jgi:membrane protease YdiL (CAAX protease family)